MSFARMVRLVCALAIVLPSVARAASAPADSVPNSLPYVDSVVIEGPTFPGPICAGDSVAVDVVGTFPNTCFTVTGVELLPSPRLTPFPQPPTVQIDIDDRKCTRIVCAPLSQPWHVRVLIPGLPPSPYQLTLQISHASCDSLGPDTTIAGALFPFQVAQCTPDSGGICLSGDWLHPNQTQCDAHIAPGKPAQVTFTVRSPVALAGLQGEFFSGPLTVSEIATTGPAVGMHLAWRPTSTGAKFALFADHGAPIPPFDLGASGVPVLTLTLTTAQPPPTPVSYVSAEGLFGADAQGQGVRQCLFPTLVFVAARVCSDASCDFNTDGLTDVRDLVLMAHCFNPDSNVRLACDNLPDCNADGQNTLDDVICCALRVLRSPPCPDCPFDTTHVRPAPDVHTAFEAPSFANDRVQVPFTIAGVDQIGAARVRFAYPAERYDAVIHASADAASWITLTDVSDGTAALGLIRLSPGSERAITGQLELTLKAGHQHGGSVTISAADFSAPDGVKLTTPAAGGPASLGGPPRLELSVAHPNPFSSTTRFTLTLDRSVASATVAIFDLGGRKVATLHSGALAVGTHELSWPGTRDDGSKAAGGVYFYRAVAGSASVARKLVLLGR